MTYQTYIAQNGLYSFVVHLADGEVYCRGAGYPSQMEAEIAALEAMGPDDAS